MQIKKCLECKHLVMLIPLGEKDIGSREVLINC